MLRKVLVTELADRLAERLGKPLGGHRAVAPLVRSGALEAEQDRNVAERHLGELVGDGARIERAENLGAVEVVVFVNPDAVEPRTWSEFAVDAKAARLSMRLAARNADPHVVAMWSPGYFSNHGPVLISGAVIGPAELFS